MAENLFKIQLHAQGYNISSAGLHAVVGNPIDETARTVLNDHGIQCNAHIARQLEADHLRRADIVLVMENTHINAILAIAPETRGKVFLLGKWQDNREIPDPYKQTKSLFEHTYTLINEAVNAWAKRLG